jgi:serine/threonine protein kinase
MRLDKLVRIANEAKTDAQKNRVGNALLQLMECSPGQLMYLKIGRGVKKIGEGAYGAVFYGCLENKCKTQVVIKFSKKSLKSEYEIGKKLAALGVAPRVYRYGHCAQKKMDFMYYEYASHGSLEDYLKKYRKYLTASDYKAIVYKVFTLLRKIHKKYPSYKHYDLHPGNVLVNKERGKMRLLLTDFGLSEMKGIRSPLLKKKWRTEQAPDADVFIHYLGESLVSPPPTVAAFFKEFSEKSNYSPTNSSIRVIKDVMKHPFMKGAALATLR